MFDHITEVREAASLQIEASPEYPGAFVVRSPRYERWEGTYTQAPGILDRIVLPDRRVATVCRATPSGDGYVVVMTESIKPELPVWVTSCEWPRPKY